MNLRPLYRILGYATTVSAATRGPAPLARNLVRRMLHRNLARLLR